MTNAVFEYDAAISFAREDRTRAEELGRLLESKNIDVLYTLVPLRKVGDSF